MQIQLRFFASVREALNTSQETLEVAGEVRTVGDVRRLLQQRGGAWADALAQGRALRVALNHQMCDEQVAITPGCEVAFFPPVTGG
ncbi:MAG: moaD [Paucimonas sp.]|jgi:molybdopterin synthase sulfur carrier subunit|nr:moaD [Paucimonas sp.]